MTQATVTVNRHSVCGRNNADQGCQSMAHYFRDQVVVDYLSITRSDSKFGDSLPTQPTCVGITTARGIYTVSVTIYTRQGKLIAFKFQHHGHSEE